MLGMVQGFLIGIFAALIAVLVIHLSGSLTWGIVVFFVASLLILTEGVRMNKDEWEEMFVFGVGVIIFFILLWSL
jgi:hypothetical protein